MASNYKQDGKVVNITDHGGVLSGDVIAIGSLVGVAQTDGLAGELVAFAISGVWRLPYDALGVVVMGESLHFDPVNKWFYNAGVPDPGDLLDAGVAMAPEIATSTFVDVLINVTGSPLEPTP